MPSKKSPSWRLTHQSWEWRVRAWERMALGETDSQVEIWLTGEDHHLNQQTIAKVKGELENLAEECTEDLPPNVMAYWRDHRNAKKDLSETLKVETKSKKHYLVGEIARRVRVSIAEVPPTPSILFRWDNPGKLGAWRAADAKSKIAGDTKEFAALCQHLAGLSFKADFDSFCHGMDAYEKAAQFGLNHTAQLVGGKLLIALEDWTAIRFFDHATERVRITSDGYRGTDSEVMDELDHWAKWRPEARHPNGNRLVASEGEVFELGRIKSEDWLNQDIKVFYGDSRVA